MRDSGVPIEKQEIAEDSDTPKRFDLIQAGLDQINQGFTVIDKDLRLIGWNLAFFKLLDFPLHMARVGTPFEDFMRLNAERGEYGPGPIEELVATRVAAAREMKPHYFERTRPTGTILAVRGETLPNRGFVTIYTDITVQRTQERLIREQNEELDRRVRERTSELEAANAQLRQAYEDRKQAEAALVQAQKMEAIGKLTGGLAHDFNNLLTVVIGNLAALRDQQRSELAEFIDPALNAAKRGAALIQRLLAFARQQPLAEDYVMVSVAIDNLMPLVRRSMPENIRIEVATPSAGSWIRVDPIQFDNALLNLVLNARDAMPNGGRLTLTIDDREFSPSELANLGVQPGRYVHLRIADTGYGMDSDTIARAFEPFFTRKEFGSGNGLGLSMVYAFVQQSRGAIWIESALSQGTTLNLIFPHCNVEAIPAATSDLSPSWTEGASGLVLLVEDEREVRRVIRRQLQDIGCMVLESSSGAEALQLLERSPDISILLTDIVMPGNMSGLRLAESAGKIRSDLKIILMSGYAETLEAAKRDLPVLQKPFSVESLIDALRSAK
jgi:signal transduction histidine kinase/CheY-like chemotaxis protein